MQIISRLCKNRRRDLHRHGPALPRCQAEVVVAPESGQHLRAAAAPDHTGLEEKRQAGPGIMDTEIADPPAAPFDSLPDLTGRVDGREIFNL